MERIWRGIDDEQIRFDAKVMCVVIDGFAKRGRLSEAREMLCAHKQKLSNAVLWMTLLGGCHTHNDAEMAQSVFDEMLCKWRGHYGTDRK